MQQVCLRESTNFRCAAFFDQVDAKRRSLAALLHLLCLAGVKGKKASGAAKPQHGGVGPVGVLVMAESVVGTYVLVGDVEEPLAASSAALEHVALLAEVLLNGLKPMVTVEHEEVGLPLPVGALLAPLFDAALGEVKKVIAQKSNIGDTAPLLTFRQQVFALGMWRAGRGSNVVD